MTEDTELSGRRRRRQVDGSGGSPSVTTSMTTITLEFGDPPDANVTQPSPPSVAEEIMMSGEINDSVDIEVSYLSLSLSLLLLVFLPVLHLLANLSLTYLANSVPFYLSFTHSLTLCHIQFFSFFFPTFFQLCSNNYFSSQNLSLITLP